MLSQPACPARARRHRSPSARSSAGHAEDKTIRIGFQKYGTLILLKAKGLLEEKLEPQGYTVEWTEFPAGPQLLEALNVGADRLRHHRRSAADLRPGGRRAARLCRLRAAGAEGRGDPGARRTARSRRVADLKGKNVALNKGSNVHYLLVKALEKRRARLLGHRSLVPAAGRRPRRLREGRGRRLGDLGAVPRRRRGRDRRAPARRRHRARQQPRILSRLPRLRRHATPRPSTPSSARSARSTTGSTPTRTRSPSSSRRRSASRRRSSQSPSTAGPTASSRSRRRWSPQQQKIADVFLELGLIPQRDQDRRRRRRSRSHERRGRPSPTASACCGSCRPMGTAGISARPIGGRATDLGYLRQIAAGRRPARLLRRAAADGQELRGLLDRRLGDGAARPSGCASWSRSGPGCSRRRSPRA